MVNNMRNYDYSSEICEYCVCTDFGFAPVGTGYWNLCEGLGCMDAYTRWQEHNPEDDRTLKELF